MYDPIENGTVINIQGLDCNIPPAGYVFNILTKKLEYRGIYSRSNIQEEQYWERFEYPSWYSSVLKSWDEYDKKKKDDEEDFYDERLEKFKAQEWDRRLNGFWYMNNGVPTYLTGFHYMYMQWSPIDIGYPKFRIPDLEKAYFMQYCIEDPLCMGGVEVTKRRFGKSFWAGLFLMEYPTRTKMTNGGIQSKTGTDAKKFFSKTVVNPFRRMPKFFRPEYDMSLGVNPKSELRFQKTNVRGKKAEENVSKDELGSIIDWQASDKVAYDGQKLHRYVADEVGKCFGVGTKIRMFDGSVKVVEDIENGEYVMGDDSTPRLVYGKTNGVEKLYKIIPNKGEEIVCNESHILSLSVSDRLHIGGVRYSCGDIVNISVSDYFKINPVYRKCLALYRTGWELQEKTHIINPYMLGVWLGDGNSRDFSITSIDKEILESVNSFADENGLYVRRKNDGISYHVSSRKVGVNHITKELRRLGVLNNKHIPNEYLIDSRENRLQLLAGILDTDGHAMKRKNGHCGFEITQKRKILAENIKELATSLGFYSNIVKQKSRMKREDGSVYECDTYEVKIYGDIDLIPTRVRRKMAVVSRTKNRRNPLKTGFKIEGVGVGEYFGFAVDRNHLFLLADGTVVHNTVEVDVYERHEVVRYCLLDDEGKIIGKAWYTTTVEKIDSDKDGVQDAFKLLWEESDQNNRDESGRTRTGLYRFFMSAKRTRYFDKYGYPDEERTLRDILADRESVKNNPRSLSARIRKEPLSIQEAFSEDGDKCVFNIMNILEREKQLQENPIFKRNILFDIDVETQKVYWRDATKDEKDFCWRFTEDAELSLPKEEANKYFMDGTMKKPSRAKKGAISVDSYSNAQGGKKYGSKASAWVGRRLDAMNSNRTGKPVGHLYGRPKDKDELHRQVMLAGIWFGYPIAYEHTADDYFGFFKDRGMLGYLLRYPLSLIEPEKRKKESLERHRGTPITPFSLTKQLDGGISYIENYCDKIDFEEVFPVLKKFDPYKRTEFDMVVSLLILIAVLFEPVVEAPPKKNPLINVYRN